MTKEYSPDTGFLGNRLWNRDYFSRSCIGEGNGNPLQCSCLENPRDGGAWWAVYGVAQNRTWLKWLSSSSRKFTKKWLKDQHLWESIRSGTGQKEKLYCDALATKAAVIAWRALELGYSLKDSRVEMREQLYPCMWASFCIWVFLGECCDSWGRKESDMTERLNWTELRGGETMLDEAASFGSGQRLKRNSAGSPQ